VREKLVLVGDVVVSSTMLTFRVNDSTTYFPLDKLTQDIHDWQYDGRAYCHMDGGYYLHMMKRTIKVNLHKYFFSKPSINDKGEKYRTWGDMLKIEYKLLNPQSKVEVHMPERDHYSVIPATQYEPW
jgi:hypothetical protein